MSAQPVQLYEFGPFRLDPRQRLLLRAGQIVPLTPKVFETLLALVENTGLVVSKDDLMNKVWPDQFVEERSLSQNIFLLRKALGEDSKGRRYIETIPKIGYRFLSGDTRAGDESAALIVEKHDRLRIVSTQEETIGQDETPATQAFAEKSIIRIPQISAGLQKRGQVALLALGLLAAIAAVIFYFAISREPGRSEATLKIKSIAVLPFKPLNSDAGDEYLGLGMADSLIARLSHLSRITVRPTSAILKYAGESQDALAAGREQKVDAVLESSMQRSGERIRVTVQLVIVQDGSPMWSYKCDELCKDIFAVQDSIAERVAEALTIRLSGEERKRLTRHYTENTEAYQFYIMGRFFWDKRTGEGFRKAIDYFNQAIEKDPNYALAYVGLADCYTMLADYDWIAPKETSAKAKAAAIRALEIDDTLAEAHTSLADIKRFYDWDWAGAEREYRRAIELNPNYVTAHQWYAEFLSAMGRHDEAVREMKRAEDLDPLSVVVKNAAGWVLFFARDYDAAIDQCLKVIEMEPAYCEVYSQLRRAYEQKGMYTEALDADEKLRAFKNKKSPQATRTRIPDARVYWQKMPELTRKDNVEAVRFRMAEIHAQLGDKDQAFEWLERAYQEHAFWMPFIKVHPHLDPLRSDPRFTDLLRAVGLQNQ